MSDRKSASASPSGLRPANPPLDAGLRVRGGPTLELESGVGSGGTVRADGRHGAKAVRGRPGDTSTNTVCDNMTVPGSQLPDLDAHLCACNLKKSYQKGPVVIPVLRGVGLAVQPGEFLSIIGRSGSGKSTLLHLLATLDAPDEGEIYFEGQRIDNLVGLERDGLRNRYLGMIFQFYHLLPELTTLENVLAPLMINHSVWGYLRRKREHRRRATELLEMVGLSHRLHHKPRELSGGEMQRAAIARALVSGPQVLLADEPTGNLDHSSGREILDLLRRLNEEQNLTIVMVTHDLTIAELADRSVELVQGRIAKPREATDR